MLMSRGVMELDGENNFLPRRVRVVLSFDHGWRGGGRRDCRVIRD
jgi:hypothetical protein